jgi:hypothetical protein
MALNNPTYTLDVALINDRLFVMVWNQDDTPMALEAAEAVALLYQLPLRLLLTEGARLPEDAFQACPDVQVARCPSAESAFHQVQTWLREVEGGDN